MAKGKILFIDDDKFLRKVYQAELQEKGFEVELAIDGEDGLEKVTVVNPDLIILDLIMPRKNGFETLSDLKQAPATRDIPVVILSNLAQSDDQKRALDMGAVDYLIKDNTTLDVIAEKIEQHMAASLQRQSTKPKPAPKPKPMEADSPVSEKKPSPRPQSESKPTITATPSKSPDRGHNFCTNCGFKLDIGAKFCPDCGEKQ